MAKQWFAYILTNTTCGPQLTPQNYVAAGAYPGSTFCPLAFVLV